MNRYLSIPLVFAFAGVLATYYVQAAPEEGQLPKVHSSHSVSHQKRTSPVLLNTSQARTLVLDGWPVISNQARMSRAMVFPKIYAELHEGLAYEAMEMGGDMMMGSELDFSLDMAYREPDALVGSEVPSSNDPTFLTTLVVHVGDRRSMYPVSIDRSTRRIALHDGIRWLEYTKWRDHHLPLLKKEVEKTLALSEIQAVKK